MLTIRPLDPQADEELFHEAWQWRRHKRHAGAPEGTFEQVIANDPHQIVIGVFNGQFCAMFLLYEDAPREFSCHFTSRRGTSRETLIDAGILIRDTFFDNGAEELCAWITERNRALASYLESLGFSVSEKREFPCQSVSECPTIPADTSEVPMRMFIRYAVRSNPPSG